MNFEDYLKQALKNDSKLRDEYNALRLVYEKIEEDIIKRLKRDRRNKTSNSKRLE